MSFLSRFQPAAPANTFDLAPADFRERRTADDPVLDVRTAAEFSDSHVVGARNIDVMAPDFRQQVEALSLDPNQPVYLYCRSGNRSGKAAAMLRQMGFDDAYNIGGLHGLANAGVETER